MTAPLRQNGRSVAYIERSCRSKERHCDEYTARAVGQMHMEARSRAGMHFRQLYVYRCELCRGWHLTKRWQDDRRRQVDFMFETTQQPPRRKVSKRNINA